MAHRIPEVLAWVGRHGGSPAGAPFFRYHVIDMVAELRVEAGVPVAEPMTGDGEVQAGTLPAGRYAVTVHHGPPEGLEAATGEFLAWAEEDGLRWDVTDTPDGEVWGCRLESYLSDPCEVATEDWDTELAFRLAD